MQIQKRVLALIAAAVFLFFALTARLAYLQLIAGSELREKAADQWMRELPLTAARGSFYDRNGKLLAGNYTVYSVYVRPKAVTDAEAVSAAVSDALGISRQTIYEKITRKGISEVTVARQVEKAAADKLRTANLDGVYLSEDAKRLYPHGDFLTQVLGYTDIDGRGQAGLEAYYDGFLRGVNGYSLTQTDIQGRELEGNVTRYIPSVPGMNMRLTIDYNIQRFAESAAEAAMAEYNPLSAGALVLNAKTGAILAMTTKNSFDLNAPPRDDLASLLTLGKNKMVTDVYEPGSTFKIFTAAAAVEERRVKADERFYCPGYRVVDGQRIKCWRTVGHGGEDFTRGVNVSCNCVFMDLALRLGTEKYYQYLRGFGFGETTGVDFSSESRGIVMNEKSVKNVDLARIGFGQAVAVTPLQMVAGVASVVNGGKLVTPYLAEEITDASGRTARIFNPRERRRVLSAEASAFMRELLEGAVREGSGRNAAVPGYKIGGKTGTAQKYAGGTIAQGKYISSFIGFAPADDPEYVVLITVDEPSGYAYYGSIVAAPYAGRIFSDLFAYRGLPPALNEKETAEAARTVEMPYVRGMSLADAMTALDAAGLQFEVDGDGGTVTEQMPPAGVKLRAGSVVLIRAE